MSDKRPIESIIAADIGSTVTHVSLIDIVEGPYRFVAHAEYPTTLGMSDNDVTVGLRRAIKRLEEITQRRFLDGTEDLITPAQESGDGVDAFIATSNAAPPLKCVIFGMTHDLSVQSAQRACSTANALVTQTIILGKRQHRWNNQLLDSLRRMPPDLIVMVGGVDSGPIAPLENAARVLVMTYEDIEADRRPIVIFAGNQEARRPVAALLDDLFDLRVIDNVRPDIHTESPSELQRELSTVYTQVGLAALPGYRRLRGWCASPILSTMEALSNTLRFIARRNDLSQGVLGIDVGGSMTYIGAARGDIYQWAVGATLGTSYGISNVLALSDIDEIQRWLPPDDERHIPDARYHPSNHLADDATHETALLVPSKKRVGARDAAHVRSHRGSRRRFGAHITGRSDRSQPSRCHTTDGANAIGRRLDVHLASIGRAGPDRAPGCRPSP
jgi:hypothetical protein